MVRKGTSSWSRNMARMATMRSFRREDDEWASDGIVIASPFARLTARGESRAVSVRTSALILSCP